MVVSVEVRGMVICVLRFDRFLSDDPVLLIARGTSG